MLALHTIATTCSHFSLLHCMCWFKCYPVLCTCTYILLHFVIRSRAVNTWLCTLCVQPFHAQAVLPCECDHPVCAVHAGPARQGTTRLLPFVHQVLIQQTVSLSLTQCVCTCILPAHGLFGLSNIPSAPSTHVVMNPLQAHKHCMHFPSLSTTFSASGLIPHRHTLLKPSTSAEQHLLFHFLDLCHPSVHLHTQQRQCEILGSNTLSAGRVTKWGQRDGLNVHRLLALTLALTLI